MVQPPRAGGGRWAGRLEGPGLVLCGLGALGSLPLLAAGAAELLGPAPARQVLTLFPAVLAAGVVLGWAFGLLLVGTAPRARVALVLVARTLALAACLAPAALALLEPGDPLFRSPWTWHLPAGLAALGLGIVLGRARAAGGRALAAVLLGGAVGSAAAPALGTAAPDLAPALTAVLLLLCPATLCGHLLLVPAGLARSTRSGPPEPTGDRERVSAPQHPRLAGCLVLATALLGLVVLRTEAAWVGLAPGIPTLGTGDPVLVLVALAGLGLGGLVLGRSLARGGPPLLVLGLALGLVWWLLHGGVLGSAAGELGERLLRPRPAAAPWHRALDHALALGPLLLVLGATPAALGGRILVRGGSAGRRAGSAAWLLPLGLVALDPVARALLAEPLMTLAGLVAALLLLAFLDADRPVPLVGAARGRLARVGAPALRAGALSALAGALVLVAGGERRGPLGAWHAPGLVVGVDLDPLGTASLQRVDPYTGEVRQLAPGASPGPTAPSPEVAWAVARDLVHGLRAELAAAPPVARILTGTPTAEDLVEALAELPEGGLLALVLDPDQPTGRFALALDTFAAAVPAASAWMPEGHPVLLGGADHVPPALEDPEHGLAILADFVGVLAPAGPGRLARLELRPAVAPAGTRGEGLRVRARNLERFLARATVPPVAWGPLLAVAEGSVAALPELVAGRRLRQARLAHTWLAHHAEDAPGSLALETWQGRLDEALDACLAAVPDHGEALALADLARDEAGARRGLLLVRRGQLPQAIPLLVAATERWPARGDLALGLALALDGVGNRTAAEVVLRDLGLDRRQLLDTDAGRELVALGLDPVLVLGEDALAADQ